MTRSIRRGATSQFVHSRTDFDRVPPINELKFIQACPTFVWNTTFAAHKSRNTLALLTSSKKVAMPQAMQIETQAEQKSLTLLHRQRATGRPCREFAFHRGEESFDQSPAPVESARKRSPHLGTHAVCAPGFLPPLGKNYTLRTELFPNVLEYESVLTRPEHLAAWGASREDGSAVLDELALIAESVELVICT